MSQLDYYLQADRSEVGEDESIPLNQRIERLEKQMKTAAERLEFEQAAVLRDRLQELRELQILGS